MSLSQEWKALREKEPKMRIRNAARELKVSEAELLATEIGENVVRLKPAMNSILKNIESLGKVMALTRNDYCVHERKGVYLNPSLESDHVGLFTGDDIDLRLFLSHWKHAFAVDNKGRKSIQFFGQDGLAMHKIFLTKDSDEKAYNQLVEKFKADDQSPGIDTEALKAKEPEKDLKDIDVKGFQEEWEELKDTHHFFGMLKKYGISRRQAVDSAPNEFYAEQLDKNKITDLIEKAAERQFPIMVFVGNRGNIQIHTGEVRKSMWYGDWFNIMDPDFSMHLDMTAPESVWIVRKPTEDGIVTAIEVFDDAGNIIVQFFGARKPGTPELKEWRELVDDIAK